MHRECCWSAMNARLARPANCARVVYLEKRALCREPAYVVADSEIAEVNVAMNKDNNG